MKLKRLINIILDIILGSNVRIPTEVSAKQSADEIMKNMSPRSFTLDENIELLEDAIILLEDPDTPSPILTIEEKEDGKRIHLRINDENVVKGLMRSIRQSLAEQLEARRKEDEERIAENVAKAIDEDVK